MLIRSVKAINVFCFKECEYSFKEEGLFLLDGYNEDKGSSNGSGKSSFLNLLYYGIYGELSKNIKADEILYQGSRSGQVEIIIESKGKNIKIIRGRPSIFEVYIDQIKVPLSQESLERELNVNKRQFTLTMFNYQFNTDNFLFLNDTNKKLFILDLLNIKDFEKVKEKVSVDIKALETNITSNQASLKYASNQATELSTLLLPKEELDKISNGIKNLKDQIKTIEVQKSNLDLSFPSMDKYKPVEAKIKEKEDIFNSLNRRLNEITVSLAIKERTINNLSSTREFEAEYFVCPKCQEHLVIKDDTLVGKVDNQKNERLKTNDLLARERLSVETLAKEVNEIKTKLAKKSDLDAFKEKLNLQKQNDSAQFNQNQILYRELDSQIFELNVTISDLKRLAESNLNNQNKLSKLNNNIKLFQDQIDQDQEKLLIKQAILSVCSPTGAQAFIMDNVIEILNSYVEKNLEICFPEMTYTLKPFQETKKAVVSKFQEDITLNGTPRSLGSLSGGETSLLSLCINMAIIELFHSNFSMCLSPIILDETLTSMDTTNKEKAIKLLKVLSSRFMIILVDHTSETKSAFDQIITVTKQNQVSTVA